MRKSELSCAVFLACAAGCSSSSFDVAPAGDGSVVDSVSTSDATGSDSSSDTTAIDTAPGDASGDGGATDGAPTDTRPDSLTCDPSSFPTFDRGCGSDENCSFSLHQSDCCGNVAALGFNHGEKTRFDAAETAYRAACPAACGCPAGPIMTDSGTTTFDKSKVGVRCVGAATGTGTCKTYVIP